MSDPVAVRRVLTWLGIMGSGAAVLVALVTVAWAIDERAHSDRVERDVVLAGRGIGGLDAAALDQVVARVAQDMSKARIRVRAGTSSFSFAANDVGLSLNRRATARAAMSVGRTGNPVARVVRWAISVVRPSRAPVHLAVDVGAVYDRVQRGDPGPSVPAVEPTVREKNGDVVAVDGAAGRGIDPADVIDGLPAAVGRGLTITVKVDRGRVEPRFRLEDAKRLATVARGLTAKPIDVAVGDQRSRISVGVVRSWLTLDPTGSSLRLAVDRDRVLATLRKTFDRDVRPPVDAQFRISEGRVVIVPGTPGTECCSETAAALVETTVLSGRTTISGLPLALVEPKFSSEDARVLGVKEPIASFTTRHPAGEPRVTNIHRIADLVRGKVIRPGSVFSLNEASGPRTEDRGFVTAGVIEEGKFAEGVGGGVSQFATTLFNAAFLGGLDFIEYQSHSLYLSRYPYGREATLNDPAPDLKLRNPSRHGVLIWASYTDSSITVTLYSTKFAESRQTNQTEEPRGPCKLVRTERTRRFFTDDSTKVDRVNALYRPEEGVNCPR